MNRLRIFVTLWFLVSCTVCVVPEAGNQGALASPSCPDPATCPIPVVPLHQPLESLCGSGIGNSVTEVQMQDGVTFCQDPTPTHVGPALYGCGNNLSLALEGLDCVAVHYWLIGTTAQNAWSAAQVNTTLTTTGGVSAGGTSMSVNSLTNVANNTMLTIDHGANQETVTVSCAGTCANPITVSAFMHNHAQGVNVIGALLQCTDIHTSPGDPADDRVAWLTNKLFGQQPPTPNPISIDDTVTAVNSFVNHWNNSASGDGGAGSNLSNEAFEYSSSSTCSATGGAGQGLPTLNWSDNLASPLFRIAISSELRGAPYPNITIDGLTLNQLTYQWKSMGSTPEHAAVCPSTNCTEPEDHINEYPVIAWDRGYTTPSCLTGVSGTKGAFLEVDPTLGTDNAVVTLDPNLDSARLGVNARFDHATTKATPPPGSTIQLGKWVDGSSKLDGRPFLFIVNGGDCQFSSQPVFQSSFGWQSGNVLAVNSENPFSDPSTCNNYPAKEPRRNVGSAQFALNSETLFEGRHVGWQNETTCPQNGVAGPAGGTLDQNNNGGAGTCAGGINCAGGFDDVSLRYWIFGNEMLFADYRFGFARHNLIGSGGNDQHALDAVGEDFLVALYPVKAVQPYDPGTGTNPSGNGCLANRPNPLLPSTDSGGLISVAISGTCATSGSGAGNFFGQSPVVSQQWQECYVDGIFVGPCAAVGNYTGTSYSDSTTGFTKTFGTEVVPYAHILDLNDSKFNAGPCAPVTMNAIGGSGVSGCAQDVFEAGGQSSPPNPKACIPSTGPISTFNGVCLDVTDYTQEDVVNSGATSQMSTCAQGISSGTLTVCPEEYVILFK